jgi:hypothetical protein
VGVSFTLSKLNSFSALVGGGTLSGHQGTDASSVTATHDVTMNNDEYVPQRAKVLTATAATLWDVNASPAPAVAQFSYAWIKSDQDVWLKIENSAGGYAIRLKANDPYTLASDDMGNSFATGALAAAPTNANVSRISVYNDSAATALIQLYLFD